MTKPVSIQQRIRILDARGVSWREIARQLGASRDTVRKYATMEDCSPKPAVRKGRRSLIDAHSETVDSWLAADVYGQINVYGVTTKSERHKRSYWTRTADGNGIGGRKAPVPYGS